MTSYEVEIPVFDSAMPEEEITKCMKELPLGEIFRIISSRLPNLKYHDDGISTIDETRQLKISHMIGTPNQKIDYNNWSIYMENWNTDKFSQREMDEIAKVFTEVLHKPTIYLGYNPNPIYTLEKQKKNSLGFFDHEGYVKILFHNKESAMKYLRTGKETGWCSDWYADGSRYVLRRWNHEVLRIPAQNKSLEPYVNEKGEFILNLQ